MKRMLFVALIATLTLSFGAWADMNRAIWNEGGANTPSKQEMEQEKEKENDGATTGT